MKRTEPLLIREVLELIQEECDMNTRLSQRRAIAAWPHVVGSWISAHSRCVRFQGNVLIIGVEGASLRQELHMMRGPLSEALCKAAGDPGVVADIKFINLSGNSSNQ